MELRLLLFDHLLLFQAPSTTAVFLDFSSFLSVTAYPLTEHNLGKSSYFFGLIGLDSCCRMMLHFDMICC